MILRRELRRPPRRGPARAVSERHGLRRGHCPLPGGTETGAFCRSADPTPTLDREAAIRLVRAAARGYCLLMALAAAGPLDREEDRWSWMNSASRLLRFAYLLESGGIQYSQALASVLTRLLRPAEE